MQRMILVGYVKTHKCECLSEDFTNIFLEREGMLHHVGHASA